MRIKKERKLTALDNKGGEQETMIITIKIPLETLIIMLLLILYFFAK